MTIENVGDLALTEVFGDESTKVIKTITSPMEDKEISAATEFETSKVRVILNELLEKNLVNLSRNRLDTGYCEYSWVRREDKIVDYVKTYMEEQISRLDEELGDPDVILFGCGCRRFDYAEAIDVNFTCPDCERSLKEVNPNLGSRKIKTEMKRLSTLVNVS